MLVLEAPYLHVQLRAALTIGSSKTNSPISRILCSGKLEVRWNEQRRT